VSLKFGVRFSPAVGNFQVTVCACTAAYRIQQKRTQETSRRRIISRLKQKRNSPQSFTGTTSTQKIYQSLGGSGATLTLDIPPILLTERAERESPLCRCWCPCPNTDPKKDLPGQFSGSAVPPLKRFAEGVMGFGVKQVLMFTTNQLGVVDLLLTPGAQGGAAPKGSKLMRACGTATGQR